MPFAFVLPSKMAHVDKNVREGNNLAKECSVSISKTLREMGSGRPRPFIHLLTWLLHGFAIYLVASRLISYVSPLGVLSDTISDLRTLKVSTGHEASRILNTATRGKDDVRVYVYNLPPKYNRLQVERSHEQPSPVRDPHCDTSFYSAEVKVHHGLLRSAARTRNPEEANFFYVPIYVTCFLLNNHPNNLTRTGMMYDEAMDYIIRKYPFYNRSQGRDHVYTFTQGFGARLAGKNWVRIRNGIFLTHNGDFNSEDMEYTARKDIVIPPALDDYLTPVYIDENASRNSRVLARRPHMAMFGGQAFSASISDHRGANYSGGVRQYLAKHGAEMPGFHISGVRAEDYLENMRNSLFCLAPEGWHPWSPRPYYAILLGCVPVVLSERQELAFEDVVPYDRIAVWVRPPDIADLNDVLRAINVDDALDKIRLMERIWPLYWYKGPNALALDAILAALSKRKYQAFPHRFYRTKPERATLH